MTKTIPLDIEKQVPILKRILTDIKVLIPLKALLNFVTLPEFQENIGGPLETISKLRDPEGRVARFSSYLQRMRRASHRNREKMIHSPTFHQLIEQMEDASLWDGEDERNVTERLRYLKSK
jgi:hypothetical protein